MIPAHTSRETELRLTAIQIENEAHQQRCDFEFARAEKYDNLSQQLVKELSEKEYVISAMAQKLIDLKSQLEKLTLALCKHQVKRVYKIYPSVDATVGYTLCSQH